MRAWVGVERMYEYHGWIDAMVCMRAWVGVLAYYFLGRLLVSFDVTRLLVGDVPAPIFSRRNAKKQSNGHRCSVRQFFTFLSTVLFSRKYTLGHHTLPPNPDVVRYPQQRQTVPHVFNGLCILLRYPITKSGCWSFSGIVYKHVPG